MAEGNGEARFTNFQKSRLRPISSTQVKSFHYHNEAMTKEATMLEMTTPVPKICPQLIMGRPPSEETTVSSTRAT